MADSFMIVVLFPVETVAGHPRRFDWGIREAQVNRRVGLERLLRRLLDEIREEQQRAFAVLGDINVDVEGAPDDHPSWGAEQRWLTVNCRIAIPRTRNRSRNWTRPECPGSGQQPEAARP